MQWMKTLKSGIQNGICSPLAKKKTQKPEIPENLLQYSAERTYDTLWKQQAGGTINMKSISLRKLECLRNEYNYRDSVIKNPQNQKETWQNGNL